MSDARDWLAEARDSVRTRFEAQRRVLSFEQFVALVAEHPERHLRDASRYLLDCIRHYGTREVTRPGGVARRYLVFDLPFEPRTASGVAALVGHEEVQNAFVSVLEAFAREGRPNRLVLLHGPNGSAKSTFVAALVRALEHYSTLDEGALYRFSWVFPRGRDGKAIGFGSTDEAGRPRGSYAHLEDAQVEVRIASELREHPLLVLPVEERRRLLERIERERGCPVSVPAHLWNGSLGHKNQLVFDALLTSYRGDLGRVLDHVRVERWTISRRHRQGAVTIGPQLQVDAGERQLTVDRSLAQLPASLAALGLHESFGELVDASGGLLEYADLLKRPLETWKYLLTAIETGEVPLPLSILQLNAVLVASSNEAHLRAFREHPEYASFRGRIHFIRVPYLLDWRAEQAIYDAQIVPHVDRHVAPHATFVAALWAVLTRLRRAAPDRYDSSAVGRIAADLTPLEKADLYAEGRLPRRLSTEDQKLLRANLAAVRREFDAVADYEGLTGASPREMRAILLEAAGDARSACLSPLAVLERIEAFCQRQDYEFLRQTPDRGYGDHRGFVRLVRARWLDRVDEELREATGLVEESRHRELFDRYVTHVSYWLKREKVFNPLTGRDEEPDTDLMQRVEAMLEVRGTPDEFRRGLIGAIAAWAIDHPGQKVDNAAIFPRHIERLREAYYVERARQIGQIARDVLALLDGAPPTDPERLARARATRDAMIARHGYQDASLQVALGELVRERYVG
ncbi:MAG: serine protein kinase PrkA [Myxococcota bacterium]|nr:serine protein kinase PrkA [Myxococcota bacterium]MDW8361241.1 serine protein kinase PrkA [Myxococcales bacterium]